MQRVHELEAQVEQLQGQLTSKQQPEQQQVHEQQQQQREGVWAGEARPS